MSNNWFDFVPLDWFEFDYDILGHAFQYCSECDLFGEEQSKNPRDDFVMVNVPHSKHWRFICPPCFNGKKEIN